MIRLLTFSMLFPNPEQPSFGIFVENRLRQLLATGEATSEVVAPVPWFPFTSPRFGHWASQARVPRRELRDGLTIHHPRFPQLPRVGMTITPLTLYLGVRDFIGRRLREAPVDLIDAHYFYPDGVAAVLLGREFGLPVVITGRGTDLNQIPAHPLARRQIAWAARRAAGVITVCEALAAPLVELGLPRTAITVLRNGVDLDRFAPRPREAARNRLGLTGPTLLSVGWLIPRKGHHLAIEALAALPGVTLLIAGAGPEEGALRALTERLGLGDRVRFLGQVAHDQLPEIYTAADALVLASDREGWANVLLEAMACGTPVVASDVWGSAEAVRAPEAGRLFAPLAAAPLAEAVAALLATPPDRAATRAYAERFGWGETSRGQLDLFSRILAAGNAAGRATAGAAA